VRRHRLVLAVGSLTAVDSLRRRRICPRRHLPLRADHRAIQVDEMQITQRDEALELAQLRIEEDAVKSQRELEAAIGLWDGHNPITIRVDDEGVAQYIVNSYKVAGWEAETK
jgi:hypothetical protein